MKKVTAIVLALTLMVCLFAGCGEPAATEAKAVNMFLSPAQLSYQNMRPQYNYYLTNYAMEELTLLDDGTYVLQLMSSTFSALILAEDTNDFSGNERMNQVVKYYGTYTSKVNELDEYYLDVSLSAPTRAVVCYDQSYWLDTANWTDEMGLKVRPATSYDETTGNPIVDPDAPAVTAEEYLASITFQGADIQANQKSASIDFIDLGVNLMM